MVLIHDGLGIWLCARLNQGKFQWAEPWRGAIRLYPSSTGAHCRGADGGEARSTVALEHRSAGVKKSGSIPLRQVSRFIGAYGHGAGLQSERLSSAAALPGR